MSSTKFIIIKTIGIIILVLFLISLLFYFGLIIPEYMACDENMFEGENGMSIWGDTIDCDGENMAFSEAFFQMFTMINIAFVFILLGLYFWYRNLINGRNRQFTGE